MVLRDLAEPGTDSRISGSVTSAASGNPACVWREAPGGLGARSHGRRLPIVRFDRGFSRNYGCQHRICARQRPHASASGAVGLTGAAPPIHGRRRCGVLRIRPGMAGEPARATVVPSPAANRLTGRCARSAPADGAGHPLGDSPVLLRFPAIKAEPARRSAAFGRIARQDRGLWVPGGQPVAASFRPEPWLPFRKWRRCPAPVACLARHRDRRDLPAGSVLTPREAWNQAPSADATHTAARLPVPRVLPDPASWHFLVTRTRDRAIAFAARTVTVRPARRCNRHFPLHSQWHRCPDRCRG